MSPGQAAQEGQGPEGASCAQGVRRGSLLPASEGCVRRAAAGGVGAGLDAKLAEEHRVPCQVRTQRPGERDWVPLRLCDSGQVAHPL